jgi:uncharacterized protein DUF4440/uncharacterized protein DUF6265
MNQGRRLLLTTLMLALPAWAGASECHSLSVARWVLGDWVTGDGKSITQESWSERSPRTFEGTGTERSMTDGKTVSSEDLRLVEMAEGVFYLAKVDHNELPIAFALTECSADRLVFENPGHDFPRRIEYRREAESRMTVAVSDGKDKGFTVNFERTGAASDPGTPVLVAEDARFAAMTGANAAELELWLADDLQYVHSSGQVATREQFIASISSGQFRYLEITPHERQVVMLGGGSALVRGRGRFQVGTGGARQDLQIRYISVYTDSGGRWRLRHWQSLRLP